MKNLAKIISLVLLFYSFIFAQFPSSYQSKSKRLNKPADFHYVAKKPGHYTAEDWASVIDTTWGEGLPTETKLNIFDDVYAIIDRNFACFHGLNIDMDSLKNLYRPEIADTVSRGRFAAIMNYFVMSFRESHNWIVDEGVNFDTELALGVPLFVVGGWTDNSHFGATLTPLPDSTLLVIKVLPDHPLNLIPGDIVLGYDGKPWKVLYKELLSAQLPFFAAMPYPTTEKAFTHDILKNAGMNWHLFETIDIVKYSSGDTLHYSTALLEEQKSGNLMGNEQLKIAGVPFPDINWEGVYNFDIFYQINYVSWGIVEGTNIGYIYVYLWSEPDQAPGSNISEEFYQAVDSLMNYYRVDGLIFDQRLCFGSGRFDTEDKGFSLLFNSYIETIVYDGRCGDPNDHFQMCPDPDWTVARLAIYGESSTFFDRPIAVLTGPGAVSHGDVIPLKMTFHPMARLFGKSTAGAFSAVHPIRHPYAGWTMFNADGNAYLVSDPGNYLSRTESHVDEEIWLTQEDVAKGEDTVVKRAIEWIQNLAHAHDVTVDKSFASPGTDEIIINTIVENPNQHELSVTVELNDMDDVFIDSLNLFDDGMHSDGAANDNLFGNFYQPTGEQSYTISVTTNDHSEETSRTLPNVAWFTTIGKVIFSSYTITSASDTIPNPGDYLKFRFNLQNTGLTATALDVSAKITLLDTCASFSRNYQRNVVEHTYGNIDPGEIVQSAVSSYINFKEQCTDDHKVKFAMEIYSNGYHFWSDTFQIDVISGFENENLSIVKEFKLHQNYPNPFNPKTVISWQLAVGSHVELSIYNILGQKIETILNKSMSAGYHEVEFNGQSLSSGVYLYKIEAGEWQDVKKMVLLH